MENGDDTEDHSMSEASSDEDEDESMDEMPDFFNNLPAINPHRPAARAGRLPFARRGRVTNPNWNWGSGGHRLGDDIPSAAPATSDQTDQVQGACT